MLAKPVLGCVLAAMLIVVFIIGAFNLRVDLRRFKAWRRLTFTTSKQRQSRGAVVRAVVSDVLMMLLGLAGAIAIGVSLCL